MAQLVTAVWIATNVHPSETISADAFVKAAVIGIAGMVGPVAVAASLSGLVASGEVVPEFESSNVASQAGDASPPVLERSATSWRKRLDAYRSLGVCPMRFLTHICGRSDTC